MSPACHAPILGFAENVLGVLLQGSLFCSLRLVHVLSVTVERLLSAE